jgi:hypothetical protein
MDLLRWCPVCGQTELDVQDPNAPVFRRGKDRCETTEEKWIRGTPAECNSYFGDGFPPIDAEAPIAIPIDQLNASNDDWDLCTESSIAMIVFVIEINGRGILAFSASSQLDAEQQAMSPEIRSDLMVYETADGPIWNGQDEMVVREALPDERARWLFIRANSEPPDTPGGGRPSLYIYLVKIANEADGYARSKPLNWHSVLARAVVGTRGALAAYRW